MNERIEKALVAEMEKNARDGVSEAQLSPDERARIIAANTTLIEQLFQRVTGPVRVAIQEVGLQIIRDLSRWNPVADYAALAGTGAIALIAKATEGTTWIDPLGQAHYDGAVANGMGQGFYHFARPELNQFTQAEHFVNRVLAITGGVIPIVGYYRGKPMQGLALDFEITGGLSGDRLDAWVWGFVSKVHDLTGYWPMIYTSPYIWSRLTGDKTKFMVCPLWIANWEVLTPYIPFPWSSIVDDEYKYLIWQNKISPKGSVPGVPSAALDHNLTPMTKITAPVPVPEPEPEPEPQPVPEPTTGLRMRVTTDPFLNLRDAPRKSGNDLGDIQPGEIVQVLDVTAPIECWAKVRRGNGQVGWAAVVYNRSSLMEVVE